MAEWLNATFYNFDYQGLSAMHGLAKNAGGFFTPFFAFISFLGTWGIFFIIAGLILCLFKKSRRLGVMILVSLLLDVIFTNLLLKPLIARSRPYVSSEEYSKFWEFVGGRKVKEFSFPSGHTAVTMSAMMVVFIVCNKKFSWMALVFAFVMGLSRIYFAVHYPTDVLAGLIFGSVYGATAYFIVKPIFSALEKRRNVKGVSAFLDFDLIDYIKKRAG